MPFEKVKISDYITFTVFATNTGYLVKLWMNECEGVKGTQVGLSFCTDT